MAEKSATHELDARLLVVANEAGQTREFPMGLPTDEGSRVVIGRSRDADLTIHDDYVSNSHLEITFSTQQHWIEDLGSTHGTELDGEKLTRKIALKSGAMITLGRSTCQYRCVEREISKVSLSALNPSDPPQNASATQAAPSATQPSSTLQTSPGEASAAGVAGSNADHSVSFGDMTDVGADNAAVNNKTKQRTGPGLGNLLLGALGIAAVIAIVGYTGWQLFFES